MFLRASRGAQIAQRCVRSRTRVLMTANQLRGGGVLRDIMGFDDLVQRMGKRHGVSPKLLADPAALERKSERNQYWTMFFSGIVIVGLVGALTIGLAATGWWMPGASGTLILGGGVAIVRGAQGLLKLRRTAR